MTDRNTRRSPVRTPSASATPFVAVPRIARLLTLLAAGLAAAWTAGGPSVRPAFAQQVTVGVPHPVVRDSFYEHYGISWGFQKRWPGGGMFFNNGGGGAIPAFGRFDPNAGARFGFGGGGGGTNYHFGFSAAQGADRSISTVAPTITLPNGGFGSIQSGAIRPFVTSVVPVVGDAAPAPLLSNPLTERLQRRAAGETPGVRSGASPPGAPLAEAGAETPVEAAGSTSSGAVVGASASSTAERSERSVKELRRLRETAAQAEQDELQALIEQGEQAEAEGKPGVARVYYQQAARRAQGETARDLTARLARLKSAAGR